MHGSNSLGLLSTWLQELSLKAPQLSAINSWAAGASRLTTLHLHHAALHGPECLTPLAPLGNQLKELILWKPHLYGGAAAALHTQLVPFAQLQVC